MGEEVNFPKAEDEEDDLSYLFTCDTKPSYIADDLDIPAYSSKFGVLKQKEENEEQKAKTPSRPSGITCWNCSGSHNLRDCTEPRNHAVIAQKRAESQTKFTKAVRYHVDDDQKYSHLQPGKISDPLREALGLRPDQAPPFVYRMRELGYPPGWVEEAKVSHSGLSMFDSNGQEIKDPELEDGEIMSYRDRDKYDLRKLIEYPGFNVPFEEGTVDETEARGACPMRESQSMKYMQHLWSGKKTGSYRRKRLKVQTSSESPTASNRSIPPEEEDMELDAEHDEDVKFLPATDACGFVPPLPESNNRKPPPPPTPPSPVITINLDQSPAKSVKRKLDEDNEVPPGTVQEPKQEQSEEQTGSTVPTENLNSAENKSVELSSPSDSFNGRVKSVTSGTPVITRSKFKYLPSPENFSKNICDVINFENLPNATGKYDQMHGLIKKVRTYVTESLLKADDDDEE